jgi:diacylglycerol kinase (ATP)
MRILVLVNPAAGGGRAGRAAPLVQGYLESRGVRADFAAPETAVALCRRAAAAAGEGYGVVAALGGDGTFHHLLAGALGTGVNLAFLPGGHGNDLARGLDLPVDAVAAARVLARGTARPMDVLRARFPGGAERVYAGAGGIGLDAEAARLANGAYRRLPGALRYVAAALEALRRFPPFELEAELDGRPLRARVLLAAAANGPCYGAGVRIAHGARMDDGELDLVLVAPLGVREILELLPRALGSADLRSPAVVRLRGRRVRLRTDRPVRFQADGEPGDAAPEEIEVLPGAVRMMVPRGAG